MEPLHPGARWIFRLRAYLVLIFLVFFFGIGVLPVFFASLAIFGGGASSIIASVLLSIFIGIILVIVIGEIYARMAYNRWKYEFTQTNLRLERGIIWKRYSNVPYERVQNVDIHRGILARMFGFSSVNIQTAGFSYGPRGGRGAEGHIPAVSIEHAEQIREFLMETISQNLRRQGL